MALPIWLIITLIVLLAFLIIFKTMNHVYLLSLIKKHFFWYFLAAIVLFFVISLVHIHAAHDLDFTSYEGFIGAGKVYFNWMVNVFKNIGKVTGYAVQQDWFSAENSTG